MRSILQDLRYAIRQLRNSPGFAFTAVSILALGLGANIAVFTLLNGILLRPLPYAHPDRIVKIELAGPMPDYSMSYANMLQLRDAVGPRLQIGAELYDGHGSNASVVGPGGRFQIAHVGITTDLFDMLGVQPVMGRGFRQEEGQPGKNRVVLIGDDVWRKLFKADPSVLGKTLTIRKQRYTVMGVLPRGFHFSDYDEMAVWSPNVIVPGNRTAVSGKQSKFGSFYAQLPEGMTEAQLAAVMNRIQPNISKEAPDHEIPATIKVTNYQRSLSADVRQPLLLLYAVTIGIWALACLNLTNLLLARALSRTREHAVRAALGASRGRLLQQAIADGRIASPGLVEALGIPMIRGRFFTDEDTPTSPAVVVVNQAYANKYLSGVDPIGHIVSMANKGRFADMRIVGVIADVKQTSVKEATRPEMYFCLAQTEPGTPMYNIATAFIQVAIRARIPADLLRSQFDKALHDVAPEATTTDVKTIHEAVEDSFGSQTLIAHLLESFAALALMIASVGLYGLLSFAVAQRTREIGVRIALGAPQANILSLVLRRALLLVALGLTAGASIAWFVVEFAKSYIYGVRAHDGVTFGVVALVLAAASLIAAWLPARRAASVDPILALRSE